MEILTFFGVDYKLLIASTINFVILLYILNKILYQPLLKVLDQRKKTIAESLENAALVERTLAETTEKERRVLHKARVEAELLLKRAEDMAALRQKEMLQSAQEQSAKIVSEAEERMQHQAKELEHEIRQNMADLVIIATKTILKDNMPPSLNDQYVEKTLKAIGRG